MNQEDGGLPIKTIGKPPEPSDRVEEIFVLVAVQPDGGEGIYGHLIVDHMVNFCVSREDLREVLERHIRSVGAIEVCRREGIRLEWRVYKQSGEPEVIT